jgi:glycosyltransferase involved in cell wall biosynthesis
VDVTVLADRVDGHAERYTEDGVDVRRTWTVGRPDVGLLLEEVDAVRPSVVHLQFELFMFGPARCAAVPLMLLRRLRHRAKVVTTIHGVIPPRDFRALASSYARQVPPAASRVVYSGIVRQVVRSSRLVIAHNWSLLTSISGYESPAAARVIPLGIDPPRPRRDRAEALARFGLPDRRRAVFFGFLLPYKGLDTLEKASPLLARHDVEVLVAGGDSGDATSTFSSRHQAGGGAVVRLGYVEEEAIPDLFALTDVLVLPYRFGLAGSGPLALAATHRTPVVVSDVPSLAETVGVAGATFPRNDPVALAAAVLRVLDDSDMRARVVERLDALACEHSWDRVAAATVEAYESLQPAAV